MNLEQVQTDLAVLFEEVNDLVSAGEPEDDPEIRVSAREDVLRQGLQKIAETASTLGEVAQQLHESAQVLLDQLSSVESASDEIPGYDEDDESEDDDDSEEEQDGDDEEEEE